MTATLPDLDPRDSQLLARLRRGDGDAIGELYARLGTPLLRLAYRLTGSLEDAEEVVQDVFVGLPRALRQYDDRGAFDAWVRRIAVRLSLSRIRRRDRRREVTIEDAPSVRADADRVAARMDLERAVARLPESLRVVFVLHGIEGCPHAEIASLLGMRTGAVETRYHRAVKQLRDLLGDPRS